MSDAIDNTAAGAAEDPRIRRTELVISWTLRLGIAISISLIVLGTLLTFVHHPDYVNSSESLHPLLHRGRTPHSLVQVARDVVHLRGRGIVSLGLLVLILTPVMRVIISIVAFAVQRDRTFTWITVAVLGFLIASFLLGHAGG